MEPMKVKFRRGDLFFGLRVDEHNYVGTEDDGGQYWRRRSSYEFAPFPMLAITWLGRMRSGYTRWEDMK